MALSLGDAYPHPNLDEQVVSPLQALVELDRIRPSPRIVAGERHIHLVTRRNALQAKILIASGVDTSAWDRARIG